MSLRRLGRRLALGLGAAVVAAGSAHGQALTHDSSQPIEITADSLEVEQDKSVATFTGNVDAVQGDMVLSADQLRVHYGKAEKAPDGAASANPSIRQIEAEGNVFVSSPRETAQGKVGVYDVASNRLTLEGAVVLTRDDNVIRGQRLEIDLTTGRSRVLAAVPSSEGGTPPERVRALFVPQSGPAPAAGPADAKAPPAAPAGN